MKTVKQFLTMFALGLFFLGTAAADTLELKDGKVLKGKYLGGTQAMLRFELNGEVQTFNTSDIVALTFTNYSRNSTPAAAPAADQPAPPSQGVAPAAALAPASSAPSSSGENGTIPAEQSLLIRMIDGLDSSQNHVGDVFHARLQTALT